MAIAKITIWLKDPHRDYNYGILLYDQFGTSDLLKVLFKNGNSSYHEERLFNALEELNPTLQELTNKSAFRLPTLEEMPVLKKYGVPDDVWAKLPDPIKDLYANNSKLHRHSQMLFDMARRSETDQERASLGSQILNERSTLNSNWKAIKDYHDQGIVKEKLVEEKQVSVKELSVFELAKLYVNIPSYLSKDRKSIKTMPDGSKKNKVLLRIQDNEVQLESVKKRLEELK